MFLGMSHKPVGWLPDLLLQVVDVSASGEARPTGRTERASRSLPVPAKDNPAAHFRSSRKRAAGKVRGEGVLGRVVVLTGGAHLGPKHDNSMGYVVILRKEQDYVETGIR